MFNVKKVALSVNAVTELLAHREFKAQVQAVLELVFHTDAQRDGERSLIVAVIDGEYKTHTSDHIGSDGL